MRIRLMGMILGASLLTGCAGMNSNFDCKQVGGDGAGCVSMDQVNQMISQGDFNNNNPAGSASKAPAAPVAISAYDAPTPMPGEPVRYSETIQRIWIAPWQDAAGNYHEPSFVYTVLAPAHWVGIPVNSVRDE